MSMCATHVMYLYMSNILFETEGFTQGDQIFICYMKFEVKYLL
jgi:hypothetical protein